ncbi:S8 family serine peptidase [Clostridium luticellarii]|jgi:subtilisin family serine protease|uniref:Serine protease AprX n=1 Tax=Clostridium luticellarii TaxID=1691940 RepID=A0A2T0BP39_9CLOT|nr:S8 family serine peptidase [Clostridium luticellarii]MCI1944633.1 S8 family serine peptidase [Clostridium luticellarii]MCI1968132.1 S8 family serine peptidase [Clostridium luticellarii]MCI1994755.1 S8 family serine peptidase [Clostridium luticellarii]MCI2038987.1 S8 family serine peptidase [Clostridium luticellarii]PRR85637.1 Serine protease AprX [Clostridium luticellarii]
MFSIKNKLEPNLKSEINKNLYKNYRVLIEYTALPETIEKKIKSYRGKILHSISITNCISAVLSPNALNRIIELPQVSHIANDCFASLCAGKSILASNGIISQGKYKLTGKGICIGIVDSGVYPHPDLLNPKNKIKKFIDLIGEYKYPYDDNGHGTFISGIICGSGDESAGAYKGIAENSGIYCIKAFNGIGKGFVSDILFAIQLLLNESNTENIKVICLPFELCSNNHFILSLFKKAFQKSAEMNIAVVVPSGHCGNFQGSIRGIAILDNCLTVAGVDTSSSTIKPYIYSSCGPVHKLEKPNLAAACVNICSINSDTKFISERDGKKIYPKSLENPYTCYTGTSCSAAYISGVCALLYENNPELTFNDLMSLLKISCNFLNIPKWYQGAGILNLDKLLP